MNKRPIRAAVAAACLLGLAATPALASHSHVMELGNGQCVLLAANGGEEDVSSRWPCSTTTPTSTLRRPRIGSTRSTCSSTRAFPGSTRPSPWPGRRRGRPLRDGIVND